MTPNNNMKPRQSGINVWLQEAMIARLGNEEAQKIIADATAHKDKRYIYMIGVLDTLGHKDIGEEYRRKVNTDQKERFIRDKKRHLAQYQQQLRERTDSHRSVWLRGRIQKIEDYLKQNEA